MKNLVLHKILSIFIAVIWMINGLICKVLNLVPRHEEIVARVLLCDYSRPFTVLIGLSEIIMAIWIISNFNSKFNAITQMIVIATMNILEFILVPDLLLWGRFNSLFALILIGLIYYNEFILNKKINTKSAK